FVPISFAYGAVFDRYYLFFAPWLLALAVCGADRARAIAPGVAGFAAAALALAVSVAAVNAYLAWNRVRWDPGRWLLDRGIAPEEIDGGFEWSNYQALAGEEKWQGRGAPAVERKARGSGDGVVAGGGGGGVAFVPEEGDEVLARFPVDAWLPRAATEVVAVLRHPPPEPAGDR